MIATEFERIRQIFGFLQQVETNKNIVRRQGMS